MTRFIICLASIILVILLLFLLEGGAFLALFGLTPFLLTVLLPVIASIAVFRPRDLLKASGEIFSEKKPSSATEDICRFYEKMFVVTGMIGVLLGIIAVLSNLRDVAKIGKPLAFALLSPLYASVFYMLTRTARERIKKGSK